MERNKMVAFAHEMVTDSLIVESHTEMYRVVVNTNSYVLIEDIYWNFEVSACVFKCKTCSSVGFVIYL